ncbi:MAG: alkyl hydroperoxide reductase [Alphaproteobacteria bacterium HGW-Alphaproteobacteria-2]|nr:MAG: alkyl hydroperoxide reductase [Alphaproteobacteria bacterium HGW-Alphaproteobacteria-2]
MLIPRQKTPDLDLPLVGGGRFRLSAETSERGTLVVFFRGLHCPICVGYIKELDRLTPEFEKRGVGTVAISADGAERAEQMAGKIAPEHLRIAYDLPLVQARGWGLYISSGIGKTSVGVEEPALFPEPGLFMINADRTLYFATVQTMPFVRPAFKDILGPLDFVIEKKYPARGEYTGAV